jgi:transcription elongation factor GreB
VSKAFTSEETPETGPVVRPPPRLAPGEVRYVTPEGLAALRSRRAALPPSDPRGAALDATMATLTVLGPASAPEGVVAFGTWVTVEDGTGARTTWRLVGPDEADARRGLLSVHAPVAVALLGRGVGDAVVVERPGGAIELTVLAIRRTAP